jgi:hypothetical protein
MRNSVVENRASKVGTGIRTLQLGRAAGSALKQVTERNVGAGP